MLLLPPTRLRRPRGALSGSAPVGVRQRFAPRRAWAHCLLLLLMLSAHGGETLAQSPQQPLERNLAGSEMHSYRLTLTSGQFIRALFDQRGIDVVVALFAGEEKLLEVDNPGGSWSPEPLFFEVAEAGTYRIEVRPRKESAAPGRYLFSVEMRAPTRADRRRLPADRIFAEATGRLLAKTSEAYAEGLQKYGEARQIYQTIGDRRGEITTLNTMGSVAAALGRWDEALRSYEEALVPLRQVRDRSLEAMILSHLAQVYYNLQDRERALENYERALGLFQSVGDERTAAYTLDQMGAVHDAMGESRRALGFYERALPLFRAAADRRGEAYTLNNIGLVHQGLREKERAQQSFDRALALFEQIADCREVGPVLSNLALERLEEGDRQKALEYLNQALVIQRTVNDREGEATTLNNIGFVYHTMSQRERALEYYGQALALSRETHHRRGEGDTLSNLMFTWKALGRGAVAVFYGKGAVNAFQQVRSEIPALDKEGQRSFVKTKENTYHELAELLITQGRLLEAQQVLDMLKEEEYFEFVRRNGKEAAGQPATLTPAEANQEKRYRELADTLALRGRQRSELLTKASKADLSPAEEQQLTQLEADIQTANQSFQSFLQQLSGELTAEQKSTDKVFQLREAQALMDVLRELGEGSVVLYTLIGEEKYRIILITPDVQLAREYPIKDSDLYAKIADYRQALLDPRFDPRPASQ